MFSRTVFYHLRDVAAQLGDSSNACLRYSESALELEYDVPSLEQRRQTPLERWIMLPLSLVFLGIALWQFDLDDKLTLVVVVLISGSTVVQLIRNPPRTHVKFEGRVRLTLNAARPVFCFETLDPVSGPPPPIGAELPVAAIRDIRLRVIASHDEHEPNIGLVEIMTEELPITLFAALPAAAAQELARVLRHLTGLPEPASPAAAWMQQLSQRLARR